MTEAKMQAIADKVNESLAGLFPCLAVKASDGIASAVTIHCTKEPKEQWPHNIFHNASYAIINITPTGKRFYDQGDTVTIEGLSYGLNVNRIRKYTGTPEKVVAKLKEWASKK